MHKMGNSKKYNTVLGEDTALEGKLTFNGILRIDGCFKGKITAAGTLVIGDNGFVEADIHTTNVLCSGEIRGAVYADEVIEILEPGKVFGNIEAPDIVVHSGVIFEGNCLTRKPNKETDSEHVKDIREIKTK